ncbi:hypothetical protein [Vibrio gallaecicus]|uniref:hypothetical protein n=1 Tax=Vibrio gallaecicus TaxID=552386 RepID=UPI0025B3D00D|nr:hypothetical protein [Vibrio gallaecicus]MDN3615361.1 hypothetical protein [Vibrio gallaecicus]
MFSGHDNPCLCSNLLVSNRFHYNMAHWLAQHSSLPYGYSTYCCSLIPFIA